MFPEIEESALKEYKIERSIYKSYEKSYNTLLQEQKSLQGSPLIFLAHLIFFIGSCWFLFALTTVLSNLNEVVGVILGIASFWLSLFFTASASDLISNAVSFGKLEKLKQKVVEAEALKQGSYSKIQPFENMVREPIQGWLTDFFETRLYRKRSGSVQFEEALAEFSSMLEEVSQINSTLVTTRVSTRDYEAYLQKRRINHSIQVSTESPSLDAIRVLTKTISHVDQSKPPEVIAPERFYKTPQKINNWEEINKKRNLTGAKGEDIVFALEQDFLESVSRSDLSSKVRHVSVQDGDGFGYDILSFFEDGREKYIEVKSTTGSFASPFYLSRNELNFIQKHTEDAFIYRVMVSEKPPQIQSTLGVDILDSSEVTPINYMVRSK